ncbi:MAG: hypothetical protein SPL62_09315 [Selenomonas sp.]|nr:hypothetical protein [Veillonellaceae bacterium]MDY6350674.1 hypothetical protein [Selenomonas sp.]
MSQIFSIFYDVLTGKQPSLSIAIMEILLIALVSRMWQNEKKRRNAIEKYLKMLVVRIGIEGKVTAELLKQCKLEAAEADGVNPDIYPIGKKAYCKMCALCSNDASYDFSEKKGIAVLLATQKGNMFVYDKKIVVQISLSEKFIQGKRAVKEVLKATPWVAGVYLVACIIQAGIDGQPLDFVMIVLLFGIVFLLSFVCVLIYSIIDWAMRTC